MMEKSDEEEREKRMKEIFNLGAFSTFFFLSGFKPRHSVNVPAVLYFGPKSPSNSSLLSPLGEKLSIS
jgi:hypothetical protein